ncbi:MAG: preprotein translocase subunit SecA [Spirochaetes bacterium GWD1_61_31]|nr:MAG: preprotein translocase subunit SecA [Spirochaetes bacterium GWB1_60_80]OHD30563.1 MAG: preprotein translocase subunit SecA [Spirochaetes bacterium GWC1_61_12]OHD34830.1 MAG: preprotein translocase subunit SecA [Spirochaetes bacterium GWD1_61_31]OHD46676.1 MAG: preprotein translocase subunit SecA [Spirochaetes bacterium GWE1_60_18]OHD61552.1 MAG: preprotein translocase subunit SecA [Spirochaetes bacterium GWF1_60_12]HAP44201.1 preprotein translocase subunit SecA [Spirochaetaceae bacteri
MAFNPLTALFGTKRERDVKALLPLLHAVNEREAWAMALTAKDFPRQTQILRDRLAGGASLDSLLPEAFALAREAARRTLGERAFDTQVLGSIVLHSGRIVEMKTGEGKTLSSVAAAYLNSLTGQGVHIVTVNDYLAERDSQWMGRVFGYLGISVGAILSNMDTAARRQAYARDITYATNNELGFDYLRDNMTMDLQSRVQRGHNYCVVDEIDSILIDEARTPLIISGAAEDDTVKINEVSRLAGSLVEVKKNPDSGEYPKEDLGEVMDGDYKIEEKNKKVSFTSDGLAKIEELLKKRGLIEGSLFDEQNFEYTHYFVQAIRSRELYHRDVEYVVQDGLIQIVDEFTGRILHGRRYSEGLHEAIEAKERIKIARRNRTLATITFQNFFRMYKKIAGMTGTAETEATEFGKIYNLDVTVIPTNRPVARADENDLVYLNEGDKFQAICDEIQAANAKGQPVLIGTVSIEKSEKLSAALTKRGIRHEVLNAKNHAREASIIAEAGARGAVTIATNMAGRGTDIKLGGNPEHRARKRAGTQADEAAFQAALDSEYATWRQDYEAVKASGGLYVIGTERHESRRIDNQLRGRSGRQGDPGRSCFFISLEDELMRLFGGEKLKNVMQFVGMKPGEAIDHPMLNRTIANAQKKVEERNFEIRKHLLEYDDVLNKQRGFIYDQRDGILADKDLLVRVRSAAADLVSQVLADYEQAAKGDQPKAWIQLQDDLKTTFAIQLPYAAASPEAKANAVLRAEVERLLEADIDDKHAAVGSDNINHFLRLRYLVTIDQRWLAHLENMEGLREAVYLRHYAQKNPLLEYKLEGFEMFESMLEDIRKAVASTLFLVRIQQQSERAYRPVVTAGETRHDQVGQFGASQAPATRSAAAASPMAQGASPRAATVVRTVPKVGRNDQCPCGSGKKYKHCHGA